jgi:Flp pilus assembly protein protease CpaA
VLAPAWVAVFASLAPGRPLGTVAGLVAALLLAAAAWTDVAARKIPNWATYPALLWSLAINAGTSLARWADPSGAIAWGVWADRLGGVGFVEGLLGAGACFALMLIPYEFSGGGAGDVKLATAIGGLLGVWQGIDALILSYLAAGVALSAWAIWVVGPVVLFGGLARLVGSFLLPGLVARPRPEQARQLGRPVPLAPFFAAGTLAVLVGGGVPW